MNDTDTPAKKRKAPDRVKRFLADLSPAGIRRRALNLCSGTAAARKVAFANQGHLDNPRVFAVLKKAPVELCAFYIREVGPARAVLPDDLAEPTEADKESLHRAARRDQTSWEQQAEEDRGAARARHADDPPDNPEWPFAITDGYSDVWNVARPPGRKNSDNDIRPPRWHHHPATDAQLYRLHRAGLRPPPGVNKGQASFAIDVLTRGWLRNPPAAGSDKEDNKL